MTVIKYESELCHHGRKNQKWYQHIFGDKDPRAKYATKGSESKSNAEKNQNEKTEETSKPKTIKQMSNDELRELTTRLKLENDYRAELSKLPASKKNEASEFIKKIMGKSLDNIGTQLATYLIGTGVNKTAEKMGVKNATKTIKKKDGEATVDEVIKVFEDIVNPRKGQKDK